jgi:5-methylcytosine-specific restriction endonuclease McrA
MGMSRKKANRRRHYEENREREIQRALEWGKANPDKVQASRVKYRERHREELNAKSKAYRKANYEKVTIADQRKTRIYRARKANAKSDGHTIPELHRYWREQGIDPKRCTYCGKWYRQWDNPWKSSQGDHVIPLHGGGTDTVENLMPCCLSCNASKSNRLLHVEWTPPNMRELETSAR